MNVSANAHKAVGSSPPQLPPLSSDSALYSRTSDITKREKQGSVANNLPCFHIMSCYGGQGMCSALAVWLEPEICRSMYLLAYSRPL